MFQGYYILLVFLVVCLVVVVLLFSFNVDSGTWVGLTGFTVLKIKKSLYQLTKCYTVSEQILAWNCHTKTFRISFKMILL